MNLGEGRKITCLVLGFIFVVTCWSIFTARASADELYGKIRGTAADSSGAAVPGAQLLLKNVATGIETSLNTGSDGQFEFVNLKPGKYTLVATKANFKKFELSSIIVEANDVYVANVTMEVGTLAETVMVEANPVQVEMTSMQLTSTISSKAVTDLPLIGRNWITLQQTMPGVVTPDTRFGTNYASNGSQAQQNSYLVNGNDNNDLPLNSPLAVPNPDAVQEVKMVTNTINPEFGRNSGAIINAITKSGTNQFHGDAFEFYRDTFLNTHNYFSQSVPKFHQNLFGGVIGGPIWKNKMFFFYSIQVTRARQPGTIQNNKVFTQAQLNGQFDPTKLSSKHIPFVGGIQGPNGNCPQGSTWAACFTGGVVPTADFNPLSVQLVKQFVPLPDPSGNGTNSIFNPVTNVKTNQHIGRFDWNINSKDSLWFYSLVNDSSTVNGIPFSGATLPGFGDQSVPFTKQFTGSWNHVFSSNIVNEFRLGYTRLNFRTGQPVNVRQPADVGFSNIFPQLASGADYPQIAITGYFTLGGTNNGPQPRKDQTYQVTDNFSWNKGRHSFKFGYDGRKFQVWNPFAASNDGRFSFSAGATSAFSTGDPGLDFLLGVPASYGQGSGSIIIADAYEHYMYAQDQWRVKDNLTLTFGAGYQIDTPLAEYQNGGLSRVCFQPGVQSAAFPDAPVGYTMPGDPGCNKYGSAGTKYNHIGPRVGFAYSPDWGRLTGGRGRTSIRGGFGMYFNRGEEELNLQDLGAPPFGLNSFGVKSAGAFSPSFPDPFHDISSSFSLANPFPYVPPAAGTTGIDFTAFEPFSINVIPKNFTTPYAYNWNLTIERELPGSMIFRVGYVGSHGENLITSYTFNPITAAGLQTCLADPTCSNPNLATFGSPQNDPGFYKFPGDVWGSSGQETNGGRSNYDSLQVTVEKRMSHGLMFTSAYTYAHSLDVSSSFEDTAFQAGGGVNPSGDFSRDYANSAFDARHRWVVAFDYEIPSLKHLWSAAPDRIFNGWRISGINALQAGFPVLLQDSDNLSITCDLNISFYGCPDRPDIVGPIHLLNPKNSPTHLYFDTASFTDNAVGTLGTTARNPFKGPGYWNMDFSLQKDTRITERTSFQLRIEFYNIMNHTNFANPVGDFGSSRFGQITGVRANTASRQIQLAAKFFF